MGEIKAGVVVVTKFCNAGSAKFQSYIDYIDREEAVRTDNSSKYNLYQDYMGNPEKTTGIFTQSNDELTADQKQQLKSIFETAQENGSLMWQTVISFDNRWLAENGLYREKENILDEKAIKDVIRNAVEKMLKEEELENAVWSAAIHYNTDNIHIHVATAEPEPMREKRSYIQYEKGVANDTHEKVPMRDKAGNVITKEEYKGTFKPKSIELCKSVVVNQIIREQDNNLKINWIIRDSIVKQKKSHPLAEDRDMAQAFLALYKKMPDCPKNMWNYNNPIMATVRDDIDYITTHYLEKYHKNEYQELKHMLAAQDQKYQKAYGGEQVKYSEGKLKDLYSRMGNAVLKEIRQFDKEVKKGRPPEQIISTASQGVTNDTYETDISYKEQLQVEKMEEEQADSINKNEAFPMDEDDESSWDGREENLEDDYEESTEKSLAGQGNLSQGVINDTYDTDITHKEQLQVEKMEKEQVGSLDRNGTVPMDVGDDSLWDGREENLGDNYKSTEKNLILKAEELGNVFASYQLGKLYYTQGNDTEAINHFQICDNDFANYYLGKIYLDTESEVYNPELGMHYMLLSAKEGNAYAELSIGVQYLKGEIVDRDIVEAQKWLHSSLSHGNEMAGNILRSIDEYKPNEGMASKHMGMSLASAIRRMQQGLKDEWQKRQNIREHEKLWEMNNDKE